MARVRDKTEQAKFAKAHYGRNSEAMKERAKEFTRRTRQKVREHVTEYLRDHPCVDCGEDDRIVLEFDHRDRATKRFNIGDAVRRGYSLQSVKDEIAKCDVRCANCHRRKTWFERL